MDVQDWPGTGTLRGTLLGAFEGLLSFGIGQTLSQSQGLLRNIAAHAFKGGMLEAMRGGDFGHGFLSAGLTKVSGLGIDRIDAGFETKLVLESLAGGTISQAMGGSFANGAVSAAMQYGFNGWLTQLGKAAKRTADGENPLGAAIEIGSEVASCAGFWGCTWSMVSAGTEFLPISVGDVKDGWRLTTSLFVSEDLLKNLPKFSFTSTQMGRKLGDHVKDFGLDPRIKGNDVVVTKPNGEFVTILKDGVIKNTSVQNAIEAAK